MEKIDHWSWKWMVEWWYGQVPQTAVKHESRRKKVMLCLWWDWNCIVHYELLPTEKTIRFGSLRPTADKIQEINSEKNDQNWSIERVCSFIMIKHTHIWPLSKNYEFGRKMLMHPPYSPHLAPSDFHPFSSLKFFG